MEPLVAWLLLLYHHLCYLQIFCANNLQKWTKLLTTIKFHHKSAPHSFTKVSPFSLMLDYKPYSHPLLRKTILPIIETHLSLLEKA